MSLTGYKGTCHTCGHNHGLDGFGSLKSTRSPAGYSPEIQSLINAAKEMPRSTPKAGAANTEHNFKIAAATIWDLDKALKAIGE